MRSYQDSYILIADAHIYCGSGSADIFFRMLERFAALKPAGILFLGDIFELWIAVKGYEAPEHLRFVEWCRTHSADIEIGFIEGNHEFFPASVYKDAFTWSTDSFHDLGRHVRLLHGDTINKKDWKYLLLRSLLRSLPTRFLLQLFASTIGPRVADHIRLSLKTSNMKHKKYLPLSGFEAYEADDPDRRTIVTGHFHTRKTIRTASGRKVYILPAWSPDGGEVAVLDSSGGLTCVPWEMLASG